MLRWLLLLRLRKVFRNVRTVRGLSGLAYDIHTIATRYDCDRLCDYDISVCIVSLRSIGCVCLGVICLVRLVVPWTLNVLVLARLLSIF